MDIKTLIDSAKARRGSLGAIATEMGMDQCRLSDWKAGRRKPEASEIAYLADLAGLHVLETVAEIEAQLRPGYAHLWKKALAEGMTKSLLYLKPSKSGPSTGRFGPHFGWAGF